MKIPTDKLYHRYKKSLDPYYRKYFRHEGNPLLWINTPICRFAIDFVEKGTRVLDQLNEHDFIRYEYDRYCDAETVKNDTHKFTAAKRVIAIIESIRKHGYARGKYNHPRYFINVVKGFRSPYGDDPEGHTLWTRKHRAAACIALGMKRIKVNVISNH